MLYYKDVDEMSDKELLQFLKDYAYEYAESDPIIRRTVVATRNIKTFNMETSDELVEENKVVEYTSEDGYYNVYTGETDIEEYHI